jgi:RND family efflux transporter MFP subunit
MRVKAENKHPLFLLLALLTTVGLFGAGIFVRGQVNAKHARTIGSVPAASATPVRVARVERRAVPARARFHGFLIPFTELTVAARVPGEIVRQWVEISDEVKTGQPLFKVDDTVREIEHQQALAVQERASSEAELAQANWQWIAAMSEETSSSMERIEAQMRYRAAEADKHRAEAAVRRAAVLLERTTVRSPIDGIVSSIHSRRGEFTQQGQLLADIIDIDHLKLLAQIEDRDVVWVEVGQPVTLTTNTLPGEHFEGKVRRIYPQALPTSRKFEVEIELPNPNRRLRPGFFMMGTITERTKGQPDMDASGVLIVPREAVVERDGQRFCYVLHSTSTGDGADAIFEARRTSVVVLPILSDPRSYRLVSGVAEGSLVVTKGSQHVSERSPVRITD